MISLIKDQMGTNIIEDHHSTSSDNSERITDQDEENIISKRLWLYLLQKTNIEPMLKWREISSNDIVRIAEQVIKGYYTVEGIILLLSLYLISLLYFVEGIIISPYLIYIYILNMVIYMS